MSGVDMLLEDVYLLTKAYERSNPFIIYKYKHSVIITYLKLWLTQVSYMYKVFDDVDRTLKERIRDLETKIHNSIRIVHDFKFSKPFLVLRYIRNRLLNNIFKIQTYLMTRVEYMNSIIVNYGNYR